MTEIMAVAPALSTTSHTCFSLDSSRPKRKAAAYASVTMSTTHYTRASAAATKSRRATTSRQSAVTKPRQLPEIQFDQLTGEYSSAPMLASSSASSIDTSLHDWSVSSSYHTSTSPSRLPATDAADVAPSSSIGTLLEYADSEQASAALNEGDTVAEQGDEDDGSEYDCAEGPALKKVRLDIPASGKEPTKRGRKPTPREPGWLPPSKRPGVSHAKKRGPGHVKRPRNAFILFRSHFVSEKVIPKEVESDHRNISRIVADVWKNASEEEKNYWHALAEKERAEHQRLYPDYTYKPENRKDSKSKRKVKELPNAEEQCKEIAKMILTSSGGRLTPAEAASEFVNEAASRDRQIRAESRKSTELAKKSIKRRSTAKKIKQPPAKTQGAVEPVQLVHAHRLSISGTGSSTPSDAGHDSLPIFSPSVSPSRPSTGSDMPFSSAIVGTGYNAGRRASSLPLEGFDGLISFSALHPSSTCEQTMPHFDSFATSTTPPEELGPWRDHLGSAVADSRSTAAVDDTETTVSVVQDKRKHRPTPFLLQRSHFGAFDDLVLPSSTFGSFSAPRVTAARPRTAMPPTPNTANLFAEYSNWGAFDDHGIVSPMFVSAARRTSFATAFGSISVAPGAATFPFQVGAPPSSAEVNGHGEMDLFERTTAAAFQPFEQDARSGVDESLRLPESGVEDQDTFQFTVPAIAELTSGRATNRQSFSKSTLGAAAREWISSSRSRRSGDESRSMDLYHVGGSGRLLASGAGGDMAPPPPYFGRTPTSCMAFEPIHPRLRSSLSVEVTPLDDTDGQSTAQVQSHAPLFSSGRRESMSTANTYSGVSTAAGGYSRPIDVSNPMELTAFLDGTSRFAYQPLDHSNLYAEHSHAAPQHSYD